MIMIMIDNDNVYIQKFEYYVFIQRLYMNIDQVRRKILDSKLLPHTHLIINVQNFLKDNQQFYDKILSCLEESRQKNQNQNKRPVKSKSVSKFSYPKPNNSPKPNITQRNQYLKKQIKKLKEQEILKQLKQNPRMMDLQIQLEQKSKEVEIQTQMNRQFKQVIDGNSDMFQLYQKMCRRCQSIRKANDQISQQIKGCIKKLNELTGKDQNPNLFIMNFK